MGLDVVGVVELGGHPIAGRIAGADLSQARQREIHVALAARSEHEVGAVGAHDLLALLAHALRHDDRAAVPLDRRHERTGDAGVASRALQHAHAGLEIAARLCPLEHPEVDAILEAATRTVPFDLEVHGGTDAGRHAIELYERRAPHGGGDRRQGVAIRVPQDRHEDRDCTLVRWGPRDGPQAPRRSSRPGGAVPLLFN